MSLSPYLDKYVEHNQVILGVVENGFHHGTVTVAAVETFRKGPLIIWTEPDNWVN